MNRIKGKKILFLLLLSGLIVSAFSGQRMRVEKEKKRAPLSWQRQIRSFDRSRTVRRKNARFVTGQVLVKFKPSVHAALIDATMAAYEVKKIKKIAKLDVYQVRIPAHLSVEEMVSALKRNPDVEYATPNYIVRIAETPNDVLFRYQYALHNTGQEIGAPGSPSGRSRADIKATAAWEEAKGTADDLIAILDTGVDLLHPDLRNKVQSGGRDFVHDDFEAEDEHSHGTFVAGIAAADTNNNEGIAGVAWNAKILPVKILDENGEGYSNWLIDGIVWAADSGADVISMSLGFEAVEEPPQWLGDALKYAHDRGVVLVAAAGNDDRPVIYPAAYDEYCLAVAATDYNDARMWWSNHGPQVDVAAPGELVISTVPTWYFEPQYLPYGFGGGTSAATPHVAGLASLLKGLKPWLTVDQIMDVIRFSADDVNSSEHSGRDDFIGYGRINMEKALVPIKISR